MQSRQLSFDKELSGYNVRVDGVSVVVEVLLMPTGCAAGRKKLDAIPLPGGEGGSRQAFSSRGPTRRYEKSLNHHRNFNNTDIVPT